MKPANVRADAARVLARLLSQQGSLATIAEDAAHSEEQALLRELCFGTCRWYPQLEFHLQQLLDKPLKEKDRDLHCLLLTGIYQLHFMRIPDHAVVNETVAAALALKKPWAKSLVNAVLRSFLRRRDALLEASAGSETSAYAHPGWLISRLKAAWPEHWRQILDANNLHPPMTLRVNQGRISRQDYLQLLQEAGLTAGAGHLSGSAIYLDAPVAVTKLPGFDEGLVSIQDEASQLIPGLLNAQAGQRVLDACSAPGGKTCHILESQPALAHLLALDIEEHRLRRVEENLQRLDLQAQLRQADAAEPSQWWDGLPFDRILLDAPCSATGIIRRHPDIKILRRSDDIERMTQLQSRLLEALWSCLRPGGILLYSTCSILPEENTEVVARFLATRPDAEHQRIEAGWGVECSLGRQLLPQDEGPDGFFFARLSKRLSKQLA